MDPPRGPRRPRHAAAAAAASSTSRAGEANSNTTPVTRSSASPALPTPDAAPAQAPPPARRRAARPRDSDEADWASWAQRRLGAMAASGHDVDQDELPQAPRRQRPQRRAGTGPQATPEQDSSRASIAPHPFRLHRSERRERQARRSYPLNSEDETDSNPDESVLALARAAPSLPADRLGYGAAAEPNDAAIAEAGHHDDPMTGDQTEAQDTSGEDGIFVNDDTIPHDSVAGSSEEEDDDDGRPAPVPLQDPASLGLKEISNLAKFTVSSHKQDCGVEQLRSDDLRKYWQSDGPQPHKLTVYFVKRVSIREIRFYVDYNDDESYTPTKIVFRSGTSENNLIEFATMVLDNPTGWQRVPIDYVGGGHDGRTLVSYVLQMQILENHQNGKDTHLRGIKIYAFDGDARQEVPRAIGAAEGTNATAPGQENTDESIGRLAQLLAGSDKFGLGVGERMIPYNMRDAELR